MITGSGADGKPGGAGDDGDIRVEAPFSLRMPVTAPTPRLRSQYEARLTMHLLVAAVKAFRDGQVWREFVGLLPEEHLRAFLDEVVPSAADRLSAQAAALEATDPAAAEHLYREAVAVR